MSKKRVLIISCVFPPESVTSATTSCDIANRLVHEGMDVTVICPQPTRAVGEEGAFNVNSELNVIRLPTIKFGSSSFTKFLENIIFGILVSVRLIWINKFDLVYINSWPVFSTFIISRVLKFLKIKYFYSVQDLYPKTLLVKKIINKHGLIYAAVTNMERRVCFDAKQVVTISKDFKEYIVDEIGVEKNKVVVISNWNFEKHSNESFSDSWKKLSNINIFNKNYIVIGYGGNISSSTGILNFCNLFFKLNIDAQVLVFGSGSEKNNIEILSKSEVNMDLISPWPKSLNDSFYGACDILILPVPTGQEHGSVPSKLINYMRSGKSILCICDSPCEITNQLRNYKKSLILSWDDMKCLTNNMLSELSKLSMSSDGFSDDIANTSIEEFEILIGMFSKN